MRKLKNQKSLKNRQLFSKAEVLMDIYFMFFIPDVRLRKFILSIPSGRRSFFKIELFMYVITNTIMDDNNNPNEYDEYGYKRLAMLVRDASTPPNKTIEAMKKFINETVNVAILCVSFLLIINLLAVNPRAEMRLIDEQYYHIPKSKTIMRQLPNFTTLYICTADTADTADERTNSPPPILTSAATQ